MRPWVILIAVLLPIAAPAFPAKAAEATIQCPDLTLSNGETIQGGSRTVDDDDTGRWSVRCRYAGPGEGNQLFTASISGHWESLEGSLNLACLQPGRSGDGFHHGGGKPAYVTWPPGSNETDATADAAATLLADLQGRAGSCASDIPCPPSAGTAEGVEMLLYKATRPEERLSFGRQLGSYECTYRSYRTVFEEPQVAVTYTVFWSPEANGGTIFRCGGQTEGETTYSDSHYASVSMALDEGDALPDGAEQAIHVLLRDAESRGHPCPHVEEPAPEIEEPEPVVAESCPETFPETRWALADENEEGSEVVGRQVMRLTCIYGPDGRTSEGFATFTVTWAEDPSPAGAWGCAPQTGAFRHDFHAPGKQLAGSWSGWQAPGDATMRHHLDRILNATLTGPDGSSRGSPWDRALYCPQHCPPGDGKTLGLRDERRTTEDIHGVRLISISCEFATRVGATRTFMTEYAIEAAPGDKWGCQELDARRNAPFDHWSSTRQITVDVPAATGEGAEAVAAMGYRLFWRHLSDALPCPGGNDFQILTEGDVSTLALDGEAEIGFFAENLPPGAEVAEVHVHVGDHEFRAEVPVREGRFEYAFDGGGLTDRDVWGQEDARVTVNLRSGAGLDVGSASRDFFVIRAPVVVVHGTFAHAGDAEPIRRHLADRGWDRTFTFNWSRYSGQPEVNPPGLLRGDIEKAARLFANWTDTEMKSNLEGGGVAYERFDIVAHSAGGLLSRVFIRDADVPQVRKLVTIATPHEGADVVNVLVYWWYLSGRITYDPSWLPSGDAEALTYQDRVDRLLADVPSLWIGHYGAIAEQQSVDRDVDVDTSLAAGLDLPHIVTVDDIRAARQATLNATGTDPSLSGLAPGEWIARLNDASAIETLLDVDLYAIAALLPRGLADPFGQGLLNTPNDGIVTDDSALSLARRLASPTATVCDTDHSSVKTLPITLRMVTAYLRDDRVTTAQACSPVAVHAYDTDGRHVGPTDNGSLELEIPGAEYLVNENSTTLVLPGDDPYRIEYEVLADGKATLALQRGNDSATFHNVTVAQGARLVASPDTPLRSLAVDTDGDGISDSTLTSDATRTADTDGSTENPDPTPAGTDADGVGRAWPWVGLGILGLAAVGGVLWWRRRA